MRKNTVWIVAVVIVIGYWLLSRMGPSANKRSAFDPTKPADLTRGGLVDVLKGPTLAPGTTLTANVDPMVIANVQAAGITDPAGFLALPLGYLTEVLLSYTQQQCGQPGAADGNYHPAGAQADAAVKAMQTLEPSYNSPNGIDGCEAKLKFLSALIKKTGRPKLWGINE